MERGEEDGGRVEEGEGFGRANEQQLQDRLTGRESVSVCLCVSDECDGSMT